MHGIQCPALQTTEMSSRLRAPASRNSGEVEGGRWGSSATVPAWKGEIVSILRMTHLARLGLGLSGADGKAAVCIEVVAELAREARDGVGGPFRDRRRASSPILLFFRLSRAYSARALFFSLTLGVDSEAAKGRPRVGLIAAGSASSSSSESAWLASPSETAEGCKKHRAQLFSQQRRRCLSRTAHPHM